MSLTQLLIESQTNENTLNLASRPNTDEDVALICTYLKKHPEINTLDVSNSRISSKAFKDIVAITSLTSLDISWTNLNDESIKVLEGTTHLTTLIAENNGITDEGAITLASITSLTTLKLKFNSITNKGARIFAENTNLNVDLTWNKITNIEEVVVESTDTQQVPVSMDILKGFIAALGITAVAIALIVNAPAVASIAVAVSMGAIGIIQIASGLRTLGLFGSDTANIAQSERFIDNSESLSC